MILLKVPSRTLALTAALVFSIASSTGGLRADGIVIPQLPPPAPTAAFGDDPAAAIAATGNAAQDARIGQIVAKIVSGGHYLQKPIDDSVSQLFLKSYVDALDFRHMVFLQTDLDEFAQAYGTAMGVLLLNADLSPEAAIYKRFLDRLAERVALVDRLLKDPAVTGDFTKDESFNIDRTKAPWPKTPAEADDLWRLNIRYELLQGRLGTKEKPEETIKNISRRYNRLLKTMRENEHEDRLGIYLSALTHAYDPHSDYLTEDEMENFRINTINMSLVGIGAVLSTDVEGYPKVVSLVPGGPADLGGQLKPTDRILSVAQEGQKPVDVADMKLNKVVKMIRGAKKTKVTLTVIATEGAATDSKGKREITIVRDVVKLTEQVAQARLYERTLADGTKQRYADIILPGFYDHASDDVKRLLLRLQKEKIDGVILDLRTNGGGILEEAVNLTALFVPSGPVVQVKDARGAVQSFRMGFGNSPVYTGPLIVLVGKPSASASEITAAALQDYGRALIVGGKTTWGKGTVQKLFDLKEINLGFRTGNDPGGLKLTIQKFYRIAGGTTQNRGVLSDVVLPALDDYIDYGESSLPNALAADEVPVADYTRVQPPFTFIPQLQKASSDRIAGSEEFACLKDRLALLKEKTIPLNEVARKAQLDAFKAIDEREKKLADKPVSDHKVWILNLAMLDSNQPLKPVSDIRPSAKSLKGKKAPASSTSDDDADADSATQDEGTVRRDISLDETVNIFGDYIQALGKAPGTPATASAPAPAAETDAPAKPRGLWDAMKGLFK
ncbi:carboxyl-terminal processing protease [Verrucomicrobium sp. GAS474]|uniref:carboxy terminal-processing peptidase n=1 Tax=Verrucomicrobium sp. GAS474 TaxID=1882831 RepID=UPI00087D60D0|nr:carboxy terminal-processing peptidase [Verrucomicrobium sp. GAS474]SDT87429.1 carboxyl-terminal processing protease [Verrucomicrobium sp. GAS474]